MLHFAGNFWWLIFPLGGVIGGAVRAVAAANERRAERRLERYRIKQQAKVAMAEASGRGRVDEAAARREVTKVLQRHDGTDARWLDYELDVAKLLDFPLMTDMREPLTAEFHRARSRADLLRPASADDSSVTGTRSSTTATPSTTTSPRSTSPRPRRSAGGAATSRSRPRSGRTRAAPAAGGLRRRGDAATSGATPTPRPSASSTG